MANSDLLHRFIFENAPVRGEFIYLEDSFQKIIQQHSYPEPIKKLLGEALSVAGLLSAIIKFQGRLTVQFRGQGKLKLLLAQCDNQFHLRGLAKWEGELDYAELMDAFNDGVLVIMLDSSVSQARYQGIVAWQGNSLTESIEGYFQDSEQLATKLWLSVNDRSAAGFLLQVVPSSEGSVAGIEHDIITPHWERINRLTAFLQPDDMHQLDYPMLLRKLYPDEEIRIFEAVPLKFSCTCTRKKGEDAIRILGQEEAEAELAGKQSIVVTCDFCNKTYVFDRIDVAKIFANHPPSSDHLH
ncbi:MAG: 33 kDa chaperonin [uncultured bacterium]|nr:MAG: 33 kDa chaperonin [uncultured bacterium]